MKQAQKMVWFLTSLSRDKVCLDILSFVGKREKARKISKYLWTWNEGVILVSVNSRALEFSHMNTVICEESMFLGEIYERSCRSKSCLGGSALSSSFLLTSHWCSQWTLQLNKGLSGGLGRGICAITAVFHLEITHRFLLMLHLKLEMTLYNKETSRYL